MKRYIGPGFIEQSSGGYYIKMCRGCKTCEEGMETLTEYERKSFVYMCDVSVPFRPEDGKPNKMCPCIDCLVKMVCQIKCELLEEHISHKVIRVGDKKS